MEREPLFKVIKPRLRQRISDPIKISYVDDDKWAVDGQTNILSRKGYEVTGFQVIYRPGVRIQEKQIETLIEKIAQSSMLSIVDLGLGSINTHALLDNLKSKGVFTIILRCRICRLATPFLAEYTEQRRTVFSINGVVVNKSSNSESSKPKIILQRNC